MASMKPAMGMLAPATASNMAGPDTSLGHPPPLSANSSQVARDGAKVLVSCWNPPIPMRIGVIPFRSLRSRGRIPDRRILLKKRSEEHTSELQSRENLVCRLLLEKKKREG